MLIAQDERCLGASNKRPIKRGAKLVGYIDITEVSPPVMRAVQRQG